MGLIVALGDAESASGDLFWDDGESLGMNTLSIPLKLNNITNRINSIGFTDVIIIFQINDNLNVWLHL